MEQKRIAILGGGAAGLIAAVSAGERARQADVDAAIYVFEKDDRVGRSILATGNGRCNFSNEDIREKNYRNGEYVSKVLRSLHYSMSSTEEERYGKIVRNNGSDAHAFFYRHGLMWRTEGEGRQYPLTNKASTILDILRESAQRVGVSERCGRVVAGIDVPREAGGRFTLKMEDGELVRADAVVIACGGKGLPAVEGASFKTFAPKPVLGPLAVAEHDVPFVRELDNIRVRCKVALERMGKNGEVKQIAAESGEVMFRKYGVSGIAVFNLSRRARKGDALRIDFLEVDEAYQAIDYLYRRRKLVSGTFGAPITYGDMLRGLMLARVSDAVLKRANIASSDSFEKADVPGLADILCKLRLEVAGIGDESICQVHRGGIAVSEVDARTLQVAQVPGLFAAGEAIDVDGACGGFNLHWAWSSGMLAGRAALEHIADCQTTPPFVL